MTVRSWFSNKYSLLMVTRFNGSPLVHHFLKAIYVKYAEIYDTRDNNREKTIAHRLLIRYFHFFGTVLGEFWCVWNMVTFNARKERLFFNLINMVNRVHLNYQVSFLPFQLDIVLIEYLL